MSEVRSAPESRVWLEKRAKELLDLEPNWDSYGGKVIDHRACAEAVNLGLAIASAFPDYPPQLVPCGDGSVQVEWHSRGYDVELWVSSRVP